MIDAFPVSATIRGRASVFPTQNRSEPMMKKLLTLSAVAGLFSCLGGCATPGSGDESGGIQAPQGFGNEQLIEMQNRATRNLAY